MPKSFSVAGRLVDLHAREIRPATVYVQNGTIDRIEPTEEAPDRYLLPGFIDAHVHVESAMLPPSEFARAAVTHGTVGTVSDPHEIANVLGVDGVEYMIDDGRSVSFHFAFGAPSCVPATPAETSGAALGPDAVSDLLGRDDVSYLSEVMDYPGAIGGDPDVLAKIRAAQVRDKPVDGHAPGIRGDDVEQYAAAGIETDHESISIEEAREKLEAGMKIAIREGSAARNFDELIPLMDEAPERLMFCSDDRHPDALADGHIDGLVRRALARGYDRFDVLRAACVHPVEHYGLDVGLLREGDPADLIVVDDLDALTVQRTYVEGELVAEAGKTNIERVDSAVVNRFDAEPVAPENFRVAVAGDRLRVITAADNQLVTGEEVVATPVEDGRAVADPNRDVLKLAVVNRYTGERAPSVAFIRGFGLDHGALASSVAHDSHNVVAVGTSDEALARAVNAVVQEDGGISAVGNDDDSGRALPLPIAGLMSNDPYDAVARRYTRLSTYVQAELGSPMDAPFMTLSFTALLVIPSLKLSDQGLFDGDAFGFVDLFVD
ncbi:adenine deaminase [Salinibacter altiplanensis]|uniref:adenine deaminase n=1 Tax=Salinibacter altiplanensis TaxID=1803181 RepID=UPI000C9FA9DC|nr:adenine deaminase [Salinibacter altiplanensis]